MFAALHCSTQTRGEGWNWPSSKVCVGSQKHATFHSSELCDAPRLHHIDLRLPVSAIDFHQFVLGGLAAGDEVVVSAVPIPKMLTPHKFNVVIGHKLFSVESGLLCRHDKILPEYLPAISAASRTDGSLESATQYDFWNRVGATNERIAELYAMKTLPATFEESYAISSNGVFRTMRRWPRFTSACDLDTTGALVLSTAPHIVTRVRCVFPFILRLTDDVLLRSKLVQDADKTMSHQVECAFPCVSEVASVQIIQPEDGGGEEGGGSKRPRAAVELTVEREYVPEHFQSQLARYAVAAASNDPPICILTQPDACHFAKRRAALIARLGSDFGLYARLQSLKAADERLAEQARDIRAARTAVVAATRAEMTGK